MPGPLVFVKYFIITLDSDILDFQMAQEPQFEDLALNWKVGQTVKMYAGC